MAKGLTLLSTDIREMSILVNDGNTDAKVKVLVEVLDSIGDVVRYDSLDYKFSDLPAQVKAAFNNALRLMSKDINNDVVEENSETWTDL